MNAPDRQQLDVLLARVARAGLGAEAERLREGIAQEREVAQGVIRKFMRGDRESRQRIAELELYARAAGGQIERLDATVTRVRNALNYCDRGSADAIRTALTPKEARP